MSNKIEFELDGDFRKVDSFFQKLLDISDLSILDKYGKEGVSLLKRYTPTDSGKTADSWYYEIDRRGEGATLHFLNSNINKGVPIAIILQYGHGTNNGAWVEGVDYINPALSPLFEEISKRIWMEVTRL